MESQDMAEVVPLFGDSDGTVPVSQVQVEWGETQWSPASRMRLLRILFGAEGEAGDLAA